MFAASNFSPTMISLCRKNFPERQWIVADMRTLSSGAAVRRRHGLGQFLPSNVDDQRRMFPIFRAHAAPGAPLLFTSGPRHGEAIGSFAANRSITPASRPTNTALLAANGFTVAIERMEDPIAAAIRYGWRGATKRDKTRPDELHQHPQGAHRVGRLRSRRHHLLSALFRDFRRLDRGAVRARARHDQVPDVQDVEFAGYPLALHARALHPADALRRRRDGGHRRSSSAAPVSRSSIAQPRRRLASNARRRGSGWCAMRATGS